MDDIKTWLDSQEKDYSLGVSLMEKHHKNKMLARYFRNGKPVTHSKKLEYELKKLSGIALSELFGATITQEKPTCVALAGLPQVILQAKNAIYELFTNISIMHRQLFELGESNSEDVVKQRKELIDKRLPLIQQYEQIYLLKEQYFSTSVIPVELPLLVNQQADNITPILPSNSTRDLQALSGVELMKKKQAIQVAIGKIQNRLHYQSLTKADKPNPMPESPLKEKLEAKLTSLKADYKTILQLIEEKK